MTKLKVISKKDGFRRAGFSFRENEATIIDPETLPEETRDETIKALKAEPMLVVVEVTGNETETESASEDKNSKGLQAAKKELEKAVAESAALKSELEAVKAELNASKSEVGALMTKVDELTAAQEAAGKAGKGK